MGIGIGVGASTGGILGSGVLRRDLGKQGVSGAASVAPFSFA
jgi:hypothetical protein